MKSLICLLTAMMFASTAIAEIAWDSKGVISNEIVNLKITKENWGSAPPANIGMLLSTVIRDFTCNFPDIKKDPVIVEHGNGAPMCVYNKTDKGERRIIINSRDTYWSQFSYQFAHELCHSMCMTKGDIKPEGAYQHIWLEESFCECASYYTMRKMAETWKTAPPYSNWKDYAPNLSKYVDDTIAGYHKTEKIPDGMTFAQWYKTKEAILAKKGGERPLNSVVAEQFLPLFEKNPASWEAIVYARLKPANSLAEIFNNWYYAVPEKHKAFVLEAMKIFEVKLLTPEELEAEVAKNKANPPEFIAIGWTSKDKTNAVMNLSIYHGDWGSAPVANIGELLHSAAMDLLPLVPDVKLPPVVVDKIDNAPATSTELTKNGERRISLTVKDTYWAAFSMQFSKELAHAMFLAVPDKSEGKGSKWFEEAMSEAISYLTLKRMTKSWETTPPYSNWKSYAPNLASLADSSMKGMRDKESLAEGQTFIQWYKANSAELGKNIPEKNSVVARQLLTIMEADPTGINALAYIKQKPANSFEEFLKNWYEATPEKNKPFVKKVMDLFEVK